MTVWLIGYNGLAHPKTVRKPWNRKSYLQKSCACLSGLVQQPVQIVVSHDLTLIVRHRCSQAMP